MFWLQTKWENKICLMKWNLYMNATGRFKCNRWKHYLPDIIIKPLTEHKTMTKKKQKSSFKLNLYIFRVLSDSVNHKIHVYFRFSIRLKTYTYKKYFVNVCKIVIYTWTADNHAIHNKV